MSDGLSFTQSLDRLKESFLWAAAQGNNVQDIEALLEIGADVNWRGPEGDTPLLAACRRGHTEALRLLIAHGADVNAIGKDCQAGVHISAKRGDLDCLSTLLDSHASTAVRNKDGQTAIEIAASKGHEEIYNRLISNRPSISSTLSTPILSLPLPSSMSSTARGSAPNLRSEVDTARQQSVRPALPGIPRAQITAGAAAIISSAGNSGNASMAANIFPNNIISSTPRGQIGHASRSQSPDVHSRANSYNNSSAEDEAMSTMRKIIELEQKDRKAVESKLQVITDQNTKMTTELSTARKRILELQHDIEQLEKELSIARGSPSVIQSMTLDQCNTLEKSMKDTLDLIERRKDYLIRNELGQQREQRLCIVCQEKEKCVVLLPCRHMCLCEDCANHEALAQCPLCRKPIAHKIGVYS